MIAFFWSIYRLNFSSEEKKNRETEKKKKGRDVLALDKYKINCGCLGFTGVVEGEKGRRSVGTGMALEVWELKSQER